VNNGTVYLVGAGPGDPGLLTCRARELIEGCDCLVHDYLVSPVILALAPESAALHDVGKRGGAESTSQEAINELLVELARSYRRVVRLKGGDPFLFGRGGEEAGALAAAGIAFEVVPGVTSGTGVPAYAGIPVTHRAASSAVAFVTGHRKAGEAEPDWASFARIETLVLYMGMHRLTQNCRALIEHGRSPETPAAAIQWGTYPRQRTVVGTLANLPELVAEARLGAPAITVVGDVVRWRERIRWFDHPDRRPLFGRRVLVTRARDQASELATALRRFGAEAVEAPLARYEPPGDHAQLDAELDRLGSFAWCAFTSANGVRFALERLRARGRDARAFGACRIAALGHATAEALASRGLRADLVPEHADSAMLGKALIAASAPGEILLPQADNARPTLREALAAAGWRVTAVTAYRAVTLPPPFDLVVEPLDAVAFASSATVERFVAACGDEGVRAIMGRGCRFYAIGPTTAATMAALGLPLAAMAEEASVDSLVEAIARDLAQAP
jgi:uroporphyrinogen III methyltransferase/synthase